MKFTCTQENLLRGISQVAPIAGRNSQLPILQHVYLQVTENVLNLTTTDLEVGVHTIVGGKMEEEGGCTIPARSFLEYVGQLPKTNPIVLESKKGGLVVSTEGFRAQFPIGESDEFPLLPEAERENATTLDASRFSEAIARTMFSSAREETRPEIRSVYIQAEGTELCLAATDGFRLAEDTMTLDGEATFSFLLPLASAQEVVRLFSDQDSIQVAVHENHVLFFGSGIELSSRLVDGKYPDYKQIIPRAWKTHITIKRDTLLRGLKTLVVFLPKDSRRVQLDIMPGSNQIVARVAGSEAGEGDVRLTCEGEGNDVGVLVNIQYVLEGLQHITTEECIVELNGPTDPIVIQPSEKENHYSYIVMPIQAQ